MNKLPPKAGAALEALLYRGELPRGDAAAILGTGDRQARRVVSALIAQGVLTSESTRAPLTSRLPGGSGLPLDAGVVSRQGGMMRRIFRHAHYRQEDSPGRGDEIGAAFSRVSSAIAPQLLGLTCNGLQSPPSAGYFTAIEGNRVVS